MERSSLFFVLFVVVASVLSGCQTVNVPPVPFMRVPLTKPHATRADPEVVVAEITGGKIDVEAFPDGWTVTSSAELCVDWDPGQIGYDSGGDNASSPKTLDEEEGRACWDWSPGQAAIVFRLRCTSGGAAETHQVDLEITMDGKKGFGQANITCPPASVVLPE